MACARPPLQPAGGATAGGYSEPWLEELDGLLWAYHEQLYTRIELRLDAAVSQLVEHRGAAGGTVDKSAAQPSRAQIVAGKEEHEEEGQIQEDMIGHWEADVAVLDEWQLDAAPSKEPERLGSTVMDLDREDEHLQDQAQKVSERFPGAEDEASASVGHSFLKRLVVHPCFESVFAVMILSNAIFIAIQTDFEATGTTLEGQGILFVISVLYTLIFTFEIVVRVAGHGKLFFFSEDWGWNLLDLFVVVFSLIDVCLIFAIPQDASAVRASQGSAQFRILRALKITKVIRLVRVTRIVRFIRALRTLVHQIAFAMKSLVWAIVLLLIVIFLFAVLFTQATTAHRLRTSRGRLGSLEVGPGADPLIVYWSTMPRSMYTLFKTITGGISWEEVAQPLSDLDQMWVVVFLAYICFAQMAVLNVLTGVFCQNAIESAAHDQDLVTQSILADKREYVSRLQRIFREIDADSSGSITIEEFSRHLKNEHMRAYFDALGLDTSDIWTFFKLLDTDRGAVVEPEEFIAGCLRLKGHAKGVDIAKLSYEHRYMARGLGKFMRRTDAALARLLGGAKELSKLS